MGKNTFLNNNHLLGITPKQPFRLRLSGYLHHYEMHHHLLPYKLLRGEGGAGKKKNIAKDKFKTFGSWSTTVRVGCLCNGQVALLALEKSLQKKKKNTEIYSKSLLKRS